MRLKIEGDFVKSDYCTECDGSGSVKFNSFQAVDFVESEIEQCRSCEELHESELRADRMQDIAKGN